ncbi:MAG: low molecular weight phosphotyrosine protein phosphatase, partial [Cutibacterium granulosum]|nr:low molecular weight phosphotyrosine protein phosphatase [Cutibacterium granulosum]
ANPMDPRARAVLNRRGYDVRPHTAHQISAEEIRRADLVVAAEPYQVQTMARMAPSTRNIVLLRDYDPSVTPGTPLDDPWFGDASGFETIADQIEAAMPGLVAAIRK